MYPLKRGLSAAFIPLIEVVLLGWMNLPGIL